MKKIIVYTANFGNYDQLFNPSIKSDNIDYILFTDNTSLKSNIWNINYINYKKINQDPQRAARYYKLNPHIVLKDHDISIWIDSCLSLNNIQINNIIKENFIDRDIVCYKHPKRICLYEEARVCSALNLDNKGLINNQVNDYIKENFPSNYGLFDTGFMIRKNTKEVNKFNELWWKELSKGSKRDQLSQSYCSWKLRIKIHNFNVGFSKYKSPYVKKHKHLKKRK